MPRPKPLAFDRFWQSLNEQGRETFAKNAKSTVGYIGGHVLYARRLPRIETIENIAAACNEAGLTASAEDLLIWLYRRRAERLGMVKPSLNKRRRRRAAANG